MNLRNISGAKNFVTSKFARQILKTQKNSPKLMFGAGLVGFGATVVLASRATLRLDEILDQHDHQMDLVNEYEADPKSPHYGPKDAKHDRVVIYTKTIARISKAYAPAVAVGAISVACLTGSHVALTRRNVALTATVTTVTEAFREYRDRVIEDAGAEKDLEYRFGSKEVVAKRVTEDGKTKTITAKVVDNPNGRSMYARCFDSVNSRYWKPNAEYNRQFIQCQQSFANDKLQAKGHLLLNDVYELLGMDRTPEGCIVGWVLGGKGDDFVSFGIFDQNNEVNRFFEGDEYSVWLDFNAEGVIYTQI